MPYDVQQLEQLMTTVVACRSVIKYNLALGAEQKGDLLRDLDHGMEVLRSCLIPNAMLENKLATPPALTVQSIITPPQEVTPVPTSNEQQTLQALYRMYHSYLENQGSNIGAFVTRFNEVMSIINDVQQFAVQRSSGIYDTYARDAEIDEPLQRMRGFIADLYCMFMDFIRVLSETLQQNNVHLDTEQLSSFSDERSKKFVSEPQKMQKEIIALFSVYEVHQKLEDKRGLLSSRINGSVAFLEFLKESFVAAGGAMQRRDEIVGHLDAMSRLLHDLASLLSDYERAMTSLLAAK